jgi:hypothetical protein
MDCEYSVNEAPEADGSEISNFIGAPFAGVQPRFYSLESFLRFAARGLTGCGKTQSFVIPSEARNDRIKVLFRVLLKRGAAKRWPPLSGKFDFS